MVNNMRHTTGEYAYDMSIGYYGAHDLHPKAGSVGILAVGWTGFQIGMVLQEKPHLKHRKNMALFLEVQGGAP